MYFQSGPQRNVNDSCIFCLQYFCLADAFQSYQRYKWAVAHIAHFILFIFQQVCVCCVCMIGLQGCMHVKASGHQTTAFRC